MSCETWDLLPFSFVIVDVNKAIFGSSHKPLFSYDKFNQNNFVGGDFKRIYFPLRAKAEYFVSQCRRKTYVGIMRFGMGMVQLNPDDLDASSLCNAAVVIDSVITILRSMFLYY